MKKLDKKQVPQFIALCVLTAGVSGYLVMHLVAPGPVSAGTRPFAPPAGGPAPAPGQPASSAAAAGPGTPAVAAVPAAAVPAAADAPPPSPAMHDPFAVGYVDPTTLPGAKSAAATALPGLPSGAGKRTASALGAMPVSFPSAPALPGSLSGFPSHGDAPMSGLPAAPAAPALPSVPALPSAPAAPAWTVTGVLQGADGKVAILRSGEARRIVRAGQFVDGTYRVTGVTRTSVTLRHGAASYQLLLGGIKAGPAAPGAAPVLPFSVPAAAPVSTPAPRPAAVIDGAVIPVYHTASPKPPLAPLRQQDPAQLATETLSLPDPSNSAAQVAAEISRGLQMHSETAL